MNAEAARVTRAEQRIVTVVGTRENRQTKAGWLAGWRNQAAILAILYASEYLEIFDFSCHGAMSRWQSGGASGAKTENTDLDMNLTDGH